MPCRAAAKARLVATVVFPTPPACRYTPTIRTGITVRAWVPFPLSSTCHPPLFCPCRAAALAAIWRVSSTRLTVSLNTPLTCGIGSRALLT